jgi:aminoglycoside 3-N-acetyltransferase IV
MTRTEVVEQLRALGVQPGAVLLVHTSYRAVRPIEDGPLGLIEALHAAVGDEGTIVMPSWTSDDDQPFDPSTTPASPDLGVTADLFWRLPNVSRSNHPFAFAALGRLSEQITRDPLPIPPHCPASPIGRIHELDGQVLLLGVGHDANTTIHLAESLAEVPYGVPKHCTVLKDGQLVRIDYLENDHCCQRFAFADEWLRTEELQPEGPIGRGHARLVRSRDVVRVVRERLAREPLIFLHGPDSGCEECDEARRSVAR